MLISLYARVLIASVCFSTAGAEAAPLVYSFAKDRSDLGSVRMENGDRLVRGKSDLELELQVLGPDGKRRWNVDLPEIRNQYIRTKAVYPSAANARVAILEADCDGNACMSELYAAYVNGGKVSVDLIGYATPSTQVKVDLSGTVPAIAASSIPEAERTRYGDIQFGSRKLSPGKGFVGAGFQADVLALVKAYPDSFFAHPLREPLAGRAGFEHFRQLRDYTGTAGPSKLVGGRFVVFTGCKPHECPNYEGTVIVDGRTKQVWALWVNYPEREIHEASSTGKWNDTVGEVATEALGSRVKYQPGGRFTMETSTR